ncbi:MAG: hypothetical protein AB7O65_10175 [Candidatus Korobacteraceae bacterium]
MQVLLDGSQVVNRDDIEKLDDQKLRELNHWLCRWGEDTAAERLRRHMTLDRECVMQTLCTELDALRFSNIELLEDEQLQMLDKIFYWWSKAIEEICWERGIEPTDQIAFRESEERAQEVLDDRSLEEPYANQDRDEKRYAEQLGKPYPLFTREEIRRAASADLFELNIVLHRLIKESDREMPKRERRLRRRLKRLGLHLRKVRKVRKPRQKYLSWRCWIEDREHNTTINGPDQDHTFSIKDAEAWAEEALGRAD